MINDIVTTINSIILIIIVFFIKQWIKLVAKKEFQVFKKTFSEKNKYINEILISLNKLEDFKKNNLLDNRIKEEVEKEYKNILLSVSNLSNFISNKTDTLLKDIFKSNQTGIFFIYKISTENYFKKKIINLKKELKNEINKF